MPARLRPRLTYANVISTLCLFVLLGGGAWAASGGFVSGGKIHGCARSSSGFLKLVRAHTSCPTGSELVTWNQQGRQGPRGKQGADGLPGVSQYQEVRSAPLSMGPLEGGHADATCPQGKKVLGGGYVVGTGDSHLHILNTAPAGSDRIWTVAVTNNASSGTPETLTAVALCAKVE
ncbi:MAG: hypothetical protein QOE64_1911 [Frankiales bacterium]|jgi:hypothetical protein|nr:hypothetical protein [Frankiales bacterium]